MTSHISALPQELVDRIIDLGADDKRAAESFALTCNSWTPRSSKHLFNSISTFTTQLEDFLTQAAGSDRLAAHVVEFSISQPLHGHEGFDLTPFVHDILRTLPNLRKLSIFGDRISIRAGLAPVPSSHKRDLVLLQLSHIHIEALPELLRLFACIGTLNLDQAYVQTPPAPSDARGHVSLDALRFDGSVSELEILRLFLDKSSLKSICLKCDGSFRVDTAIINAFLRLVGHNLEHFRFELPLDGWVIAGAARNDLTSLTQLSELRRVELVSPRRAIRRRGTTVSKGLWFNMLPVLSYIPSSVHHIRLYVNLYHVHPSILASWDYSQLETILAGCADLMSVEITLLTEQEGRAVPVGAEESAEVQKIVHARATENFGRMLRFT